MLGGGTPVPTCTLDILIERYEPFDAMKEDRLLGLRARVDPAQQEDEEIKKILIEYHGGHEDFVRRLKEEFDIKFSRSLVGPKLYRSAASPELGYIYETKVTIQK